MSQVIQIKRNVTDGKLPSDLLAGELAYVEATNKLYIGTGGSFDEHWENVTLLLSPNAENDELEGDNNFYDYARDHYGFEENSSITKELDVPSNWTDTDGLTSYYTSTMELDATGNALDPFADGGNPWTFEAWWKKRSNNSNQGYIYAPGFRLGRQGGRQPNSHYLWLPQVDNGIETDNYPTNFWASETVPAPYNEWMHLAITFDGSRYRSWIDGQVWHEVVSSNTSVDIGKIIFGGPTSSEFSIFVAGNTPNAWTDVRITNNICRYTETFYPLSWTSPFATNAQGGIREIKPEFLTYATASTSDKITIKNQVNEKTYVLSAPNDLAGDITYTLPPSTPTEKTVVVSDETGQLSYGDFSIENLSDIENVEDSPENTEILTYDGSNWVGIKPEDLEIVVDLDPTSNQEYKDLRLLEYLEVKGNSVQLNSANLAIRDKMMGIGSTGITTQVSATMDNGIVTLSGDLGNIESDDTIFIGDGNDNIPSGYYNFLSVGAIIGGSDTTYLVDDEEWTVHTFAFGGSDPVDQDKSMTMNLSGPVTADILIVGGGGGSHGNGNSPAGHAGGFQYYEKKTLTEGLYNITIGRGGYGEWSSGHYGGGWGQGSGFLHTDGSISLGVGNTATTNQGGGHGYVLWGGHGARISRNNNSPHGGHGWSEGDIVPNSGDPIIKILVEDAFVNDSNVHPTLNPYDPDIHITKSDAITGINKQHDSLSGGGNFVLGDHPYSEVDGGVVTTETVVTNQNINVVGSRFLINGLAKSYSGGGGGWHSVGNVTGNPGVGAKVHSNHQAGGGSNSDNTGNGRGASGIIIIRYQQPTDIMIFDSGTNLTISEEFEVTIEELSTTEQSDGAGIIFPGDTEKSLLWYENSADPHFKFTGGDLKVAGKELHLNNEKIIDSDDDGEKTISGVDNVTASQVVGSFDGGSYE